MTAMAAPPEALGAITEGPPGPPQAKPPDEHGFQGALEDSLARTATAEGHKEAESGESVPTSGPASSAQEITSSASPGDQSATADSTSGPQSSTAPVAGKAHGHGRHQTPSSANAANQVTVDGPVQREENTASTSGEVTDGSASSAVDAQSIAGASLKVTANATGNPPTLSQSTGTEVTSTDVATAQKSAAAQAEAPVSSITQVPPSSNGETSHSPSADMAAAGDVVALSDSSSGAPAQGTSSGAPAEDTSNGAGSNASTSVRPQMPWLDASTPAGGTQAGSKTPVDAGAAPVSPLLEGTSKDAHLPPGVASTQSSTTPVAHSAIANRLSPVSQSMTATTQAATSAEASSNGVSTGGQAVSGTPDLAAPTTSPAANSTPWSDGANLQQTIETIHATVALASRQGAASAQIQLEPAELGVVKIHLTQTSEGLLARVSAETAAGAQAIASGQGELHQTLSSLGISLLRLDLGGSFARQEAQARGNAPQGSHQQAGRLGDIGEQPEEADAVTSVTAVSLSPNSALIDVLA
jgi:flagellar hook-length control protein FliK